MISLLRRLFGTPSVAPPEPTPPGRSSALAMVLLRGTDGIDPDALRAAVAAQVREVAGVGEWTTEQGASTAAIPGGMVGFVVLPAAVPAGDLDGPVTLAWHWPDAAEAVTGHTAHVVVFVRSTELDAVDTHLLLTRAVGAVASHADAIGVYVGNALLVRPAAEYARDAATATRESLPLLCWIGFQPVADRSRLSAYTTGLSAFGHLELEVRRSRQAFPDLLGTLADIASYQLSTGAQLGDGDTFGPTADQRTRVRHRPSRFLPDARVALVELP